jgi:asparagine synthase (glutamine-hydrolysing)
MCGIAGWYNLAGKTAGPAAGPLLERMCNVIIHRGPDDKGYYLDDKAALGMRRLSIIDLSTGHQPIHNEDNTLWIVFNGEIYNFSELRKNLEQKHKFYTNSDTEVIIHLYEQYGEKCVEHLRGMFAFAIWDSKQDKLFLAKDRIGKKPLYYTQKNGTLVFGSEIKCILEYLGETPQVNYEAIDLFLTYQYIPSPKTIFKGIFSLPPAHTLACGKNGDINISKYWDLDYRNKTNISFKDACSQTIELLEEAVKIRMIADVPLGAFLSISPNCVMPVLWRNILKLTTTNSSLKPTL